MLNIKEQFWYWAFRYSNNDEPAILVAMSHPGHRADVHRLIRRNQLVDPRRQVHTDQITSEEWKTWHAFDLCPTIEVYIKDPDKKDDGLAYRVIEP